MITKWDIARANGLNRSGKIKNDWANKLFHRLQIKGKIVNRLEYLANGLDLGAADKQVYLHGKAIKLGLEPVLTYAVLGERESERGIAK